MKRRNFIGTTMAGGALMGNSIDVARAETATSIPPKSSFLRKGLEFADNLYIEREATGQPHSFG